MVSGLHVLRMNEQIRMMVVVGKEVKQNKQTPWNYHVNQLAIYILFI